MPTLKDIANQVGVSVSTVSRVINNDTSRQINAETKKRIWEVVVELGYKPNEAARNLVQNKREEAKPSMQVGCIVMKPQFPRAASLFLPHFIRVEQTVAEFWLYINLCSLFG